MIWPRSQLGGDGGWFVRHCTNAQPAVGRGSSQSRRAALSTQLVTVTGCMGSANSGTEIEANREGPPLFRASGEVESCPASIAADGEEGVTSLGGVRPQARSTTAPKATSGHRPSTKAISH